MNNKLLKTMIGAALIAAPISYSAADVKIYGSIAAEYANEDLDGESAEQGIDDNGNRSRIGFKATEKLGNGMTAIALAEFRFNPVDDAFENGANTNNAFVNRQIFVGLKHKKWGFIALGTFNSPYKSAGGAKLDPLWFTALESRGAGGMSTAAGSAGFAPNQSGNVNGLFGHNAFIANTIYYKSPKWNNLRLDFALVPDEQSGFNRGAKDGEDIDGSRNGDDNDWGVALHYNLGPIWAFWSYGVNNIDNANDAGVASGEDEFAWKLGAQISLGSHVLSMQYESIHNAFTLSGGLTNQRVSRFSQISRGQDGDIWFLGYQYKMGNNTFAIQIGETDTDGEDANGLGNETEYFALGIIHKFSKKTRIIAGYSESDTNGEQLAGRVGDREVIAVSLRKDF